MIPIIITVTAITIMIRILVITETNEKTTYPKYNDNISYEKSDYSNDCSNDISNGINNSIVMITMTIIHITIARLRMNNKNSDDDTVNDTKDDDNA